MGDLTKNFSYKEFGCRCKKCKYKDGYQVDLALVKKLQLIRDAYGKPMPINSGIRCPAWNYHSEGKSLSFHLPSQSCLAADIGVSDRRGKIFIVSMALELGLSVGVYRTFIHIDRRPAQVIF